MKFYSFTYLCASLYVDIYKSLISPHISEVQSVCGLNSDSCYPFISPNDWLDPKSWKKTTDPVTNQIFHSITA